MGSGPHLCFLHGFCEDSTIWNPVVESLKETYTCLAIDLPGFGNSQDVSFGSINEVANQVHALLENEKISDPIIFGHSLGGYILAEYLHLFQDIGGAVFIHSTAYADSDAKKINRQKAIDFVNRNGTAPFYRAFLSNLTAPEHTERLLPSLERMVHNTPQSSVTDGLKAMRDRKDRVDALRNSKCPILFLHGELDAYYPLESILRQAASCEAAQIDVIPNVGHLSMLEDKKKCLMVIRHFLDFIKSLK